MLVKNKSLLFISFFAIIVYGYFVTEKSILFAQPNAGQKDKENKGKTNTFVYDSKKKRDPFMPLVDSSGRILEIRLPAETATGLYLKGIVYDSKGESYAIIDEDVFKVGDRVGEYQVFKVESQRVILVKDGEVFEVELIKED